MRSCKPDTSAAVGVNVVGVVDERPAITVFSDSATGGLVLSSCGYAYA